MYIEIGRGGELWAVADPGEGVSSPSRPVKNSHTKVTTKHSAYTSWFFGPLSEVSGSATGGDGGGGGGGGGGGMITAHM